MANITRTLDNVIDKLSEDVAIKLLPISVTMVGLMICGLFGNITVCQFYRAQAKSTPIAKLIISMAVIDTVNCAFMPKHIVDMCFSYKYSFVLLCKTDALLTHLFGLSSAFTVVTIAVFRYRMVCRPLSKQFTFRNAYVTIIVTVLAAFCFSTPAIFAVDVIHLNVTIDNGVIVPVKDCNKDQINKTIMHIVINAIHIVLFIAGSSILLALYGIMGLKIWRYSHKRNTMTGYPTVSRVHSFRKKSRYISSLSGKKYNINANEFYVWVDLPTQDSLASTDNQSQLTLRKRKDATNLVAARQTLMLSTISLILVIAYLPYTAMSVYTTSTNTPFTRDALSQICLRSIVLGSALNPIVYGLFNADFRAYVKKTICGCSE